MIRARVDFVLYELGDKSKRHYFTGQKWFDIDDPMFILAIKTADNLIGDNGFIDIRISRKEFKFDDGVLKENEEV